MSSRFLRILLAGFALACAVHQAQASERSTARQARAMFDRAVKFLDGNGPDRAFAAFNDRKGQFVHKDLYVFVIDRNGVYRANGASPNTLVGLTVLDSRDAAGNPLFHDMIDAVKDQPEGMVRYVWLDRLTNRVEPKVTYLHRSGDYILGVGYYAPRSSADDARKMLGKAVNYMHRYGLQRALATFDNHSGPFIRDDLYVFVIGLASGRFEAMGMKPALVGTDAREIHDVEGRPLVEEMIALARDKGEGSVDYIWRNPVTNAIEKKTSFIRRVGDSLVGVGYYRE